MKRALGIVAVVLAATVGCDKVGKDMNTISPKTTDLGTGLNAVERAYDRPAGGLLDVALASLKSYDLKLETDKHDDLGGELVALRADGHKVTVKITSVDKDHSTVSVRVAPGNRDLAEMIHQRIAEKLGAETKK